MSKTKLDPLTLERLAAGALDESETARLMERLSSEEGGLERLDALMQSNEEFFQNYPANIVVPQVMDQYKRDKRRQTRGEKKMITHAMALKVALACSTLVVGGILYTQFAPAPELTAVAQSPVSEASPVLPAAVSSEQTQEVPNRENHPVEEMNEVKYGTKRTVLQSLLDLDELLLVEGSTRDFDGTGVSRISVEESALVKTSAADQVITLEGLKVGITGMQVHSKEEVRAVYVRVAHAYPEELREEMKAELDPAVRACAEEHGEGQLLGRVVVDRKGVILRVQWDATTLAPVSLRQCVSDALMAREFKTLDKPEVTIATMSWSL